jgi:hypothetical protein
VLGENCRSGCKTRDHASWGDCARASRITVTPVDGQAKRIDHELGAYAEARRQGIQPAGTSLAQTQAAVRVSNDVGMAYDANTESFKS